jgi:hypothetical protein
MSQHPPPSREERRSTVYRAASDFFLLQNRDYPRKSALEWVGNRYALAGLERDLLRRGVFAQKAALSRLGKRVEGAGWRERPLYIDGHNVQITIESHILGRILLRANDGALRDLAGQSASFRISETSLMAQDMIFRFLESFAPGEVFFLFDAPMSRSGELAAMYRERMRKAGIHGEARTAPVPERELGYAEGVIASSDQAVLDRSVRWLDLACSVIEYFGPLDPTADFSPLVLAGYPFLCRL